jgi:indolepyruvate ferredoxin oxidoreductase, alpha subunit
MAERSFKKEVESLRLGEGDEFRGEGILAVTKALLQSGVSYVAGYQGAPISHLMDVLTDANDILQELGIRFEHSASEATAAATLAASVNYPLRGAVTFKSTVGTNVASDALANLASGGVMGGAMIIVGEDYGEGSSIMQERSHAFAMKSQIWLLDPRPNLTSIVDMVEKGFQLSEASNTPVMLELRIRACHVHGRFKTKANKRASFNLKNAMESPQRDTNRIALPPATYLHEQEKINSRWPNALRFIQERQLNEFFGEDASGAPTQQLGIVLQGGMYNGVIRALQSLGLADTWGESKIPLYVLNVTYPLVDEEFKRFCAAKRAVMLVEEGQPDFIEQNVNTILRRANLQTKLHGKDFLPMAGEYIGGVMLKGLRAFLECYGAVPLADSVEAKVEAQAAAIIQEVSRASKAAAQLSAGQVSVNQERTSQANDAQAKGTALGTALRKVIPIQSLDQAELAEVVHGRPPSFCTGCPERPIFTAIKLLEREIGQHHISADIGCHLFSILPPFNLGATTMGYGLGWAGASAFNTQETDKRTISIMGDGGFWHNGLTSGVGNAVFNKSDNLLIVVDNGYSAATGGQDILSSKASNTIRATNNPIAKAVQGVGVTWVRTIDRTYDLKAMKKTLKEALTTTEKGPKVLVAQSECMLNKQRRTKPQVKAAVERGERMVRERFGVDSDTCTGDHSCIRLSGCPSLSIKPNPDSLRRDPVATVLDSCVGCGLCGEASQAAVLCPSFYKASIVSNPAPWDRFKQALRTKVISWLQRRIDRRLMGIQA